MVAFRVSPVELVDRFRSRPRAEYEEEELPEPRPRERRRSVPEPEPAAAPAAKRQAVPQIDIPVDDGPLVGKRVSPSRWRRRPISSTASPPCPPLTRCWPAWTG